MRAATHPSHGNAGNAIAQRDQAVTAEAPAVVVVQSIRSSRAGAGRGGRPSRCNTCGADQLHQQGLHHLLNSHLVRTEGGASVSLQADIFKIGAHLPLVCQREGCDVGGAPRGSVGAGTQNNAHLAPLSVLAAEDIGPHAGGSLVGAHSRSRGSQGARANLKLLVGRRRGCCGGGMRCGGWYRRGHRRYTAHHRGIFGRRVRSARSSCQRRWRSLCCQHQSR
jgi:hypothetical protein